MVFDIILFVAASVISAVLLYSVLCYTPGEESRKEEKREEKTDG